MDRTEASDAFDAGSIPVGCIMKNMRKDTMNKKNLRDHLSFKEAFHQVTGTIKDYLLFFKEWITDYGKIILPILLLILVSVTVVISLNARERVELDTQKALEVLEETKADVQEVKETVFEEDAHPEINKMILSYYEALEMADIDVLIDLQSAVTQTESIRLEKMSEYIDRYENIHVYTKPGPYIDTYIAYVTSDVYLKDREECFPGLHAFFVCMDEFGNYYINNNELTPEEEYYIRDVSNQSDVLDLKNSVNVNYARIMEENEELRDYWAKLSVEIDLAVGEKLALDAKLKQLEESADAGEPVSEPEEPDVPEEPVVIKVKTTDRVNVRKSASATADKLGSAEAGSVYVLIEEMANGWSKINYEGKDAFIKSEYLVKVEDISKVATQGTVSVNTETLNVRAEASQTSAKLGVLVKDQIVELVEYVNDGEWCKIKFNGQIGYIKAEYVR